jgi:hypothetical protein
MVLYSNGYGVVYSDGYGVTRQQQPREGIVAVMVLYIVTIIVLHRETVMVLQNKSNGATRQQPERGDSDGYGVTKEHLSFY